MTIKDNIGLDMMIDQNNSETSSILGGKKRSIQIHIQGSISNSKLQKENHIEPAIKNVRSVLV